MLAVGACSGLHAEAFIAPEHSLADVSPCHHQHSGLPCVPADVHRRPLERLLRKLLAMPTQLLVLLHSHAWLEVDLGQGVFFNNAERDFSELALYYGLPSVSVKACCYEAMRHAVPGFQVTWSSAGISVAPPLTDYII